MTDRYRVEKDGEVVKVYDHVNVSRQYYVNSVNGYEEFQAKIGAGMEHAKKPEFVTERIAKLLYGEFGVRVEEQGIEAVDVRSDDVKVL